MGKQVVWRFDLRDFQRGDIVLPDLQKPPSLTDEDKLAESALCTAKPALSVIRSTALYCYKLRTKAFAGAIGYRAFLYELEIDDDDILDEGDLGFYEDIKNQWEDKEAVKRAVSGYIEGHIHPSRPIAEVLVKRARVVANHGKQKIFSDQSNDASDYGL